MSVRTYNCHTDLIYSYFVYSSMFVYIERVISIMCTVTKRKNNKNNDNNNDNSNDINKSHRN